MIDYMNGTIIDKNDNHILILVNNIGYNVLCTSAIYNTYNIDDNIKLYTYMHINDNNILLYGFINFDEKNVFLKLITINGIGPKIAINILSNINYNKLIYAIQNNNLDTLCQIKGLSKKKAETILLELHDKFNDIKININNNIDNINIEKQNKDIISVLMSLKFNKNDIVSLIKQARSININETQQIIEYVIKNIS